MRSLSAVFLVAAVLALAGCASTPQVAPQSVAQGAGAPQSAPVRQDQPSHNVGGSSVVIMPGAIPAGSEGKIEIHINNGPSADASGDVKAAESQRTGAQSLSQRSELTQTVSVDPKAVGEAASALLATVNPTGAAATLAKAAVDQSKNGSPALSQQLLDAAKAAALKEASPAPAPPEGAKPVEPSPTPPVVVPSPAPPAPAPGPSPPEHP